MCVCVAVSMALACCVSTAAIDPRTVVGAWLFDDEDADLEVDASGHERHGEYRGVPASVEGKFGRALDFSGAGDAVTIPGLGLEFPGESITIVAWVNIEKFRNQDIFAIDPLEPKRALVIMGDIGFHWYFGDPNVAVLAPFGDAWVDVWTHFAFVSKTSEDRKEKFMAIYTNGVKFRRAGLLAGDFHPRDADFHIGGREESSFEGAIDEFAIFDVALSEEQIQAVMSQGLGRAALGQSVDPLGKTAASWAALKQSF